MFAELPSRILTLADAMARGKLAQLLAEAGASGTDPEPSVELSPAPGWGGDPDDRVRDLLRLPVHKPTTLNVHIPMTTLLGLDHRAGHIPGVGPVAALHCRALLPVAGLRRVAVDAGTGQPLTVEQLLFPPPTPPPTGPAAGPEGVQAAAAEQQRARLLDLIGLMVAHDGAEPQHDPSRALRRLVQVRDLTCTGPGCTRSAEHCELDHEVAYAEGGQTAVWNLGSKSTRCHHARHDGWDVTRDETTGTSTWTSPAGSVYLRRSAWPAPPAIPDDLTLPAPRVVELDRLDDDRPERPLWPDPPSF